MAKTFEDWWQEFWTISAGTGILDSAFKEMCHKAWHAAIEAERDAQEEKKSNKARPYRWKHVATGLYYTPCRNVKKTFKDASGKMVTLHTKSNLSKKGKVYTISVSAPRSFLNDVTLAKTYASKVNESTYLWHRSYPSEMTVEDTWLKEFV